MAGHRMMRGDQQSGAGIVLGKHWKKRRLDELNELGYDLDDDKLQAIFVGSRRSRRERKVAWTMTTSKL